MPLDKSDHPCPEAVTDVDDTITSVSLMLPSFGETSETSTLYKSVAPPPLQYRVHGSLVVLIKNSWSVRYEFEP
ncbi:hypothetical protein TNCV_46171 [Trichonephila clavipes]|nr:hypothetical protein TNCV_46171 [Trichonephila clavipes]